jgi:transglutaminase-like putative cysteine protease
MNLLLEKYLRSTEIIDWKHPEIIAKAEKLAAGKVSATEISKACFEWVRDHIRHIGDYNIQTVSVSASEVLLSGSGVCYAKSHLLAALLRANSIPAGFCYQRLSRGNNGAFYCLHGLNAVYLPETGWYRVDARGNKEGVNAQFTPPKEQLAFAVNIVGEIDFPKTLSDPLPIIIEVLKKYKNKDELWNNLPDLQLM